MNPPRGWALALALAAGCGSSPPTGAPPVTVPAAPTTSLVESDLPPDLRPVAAPENLLAVLRVSQPSKVADVAMRWANLPVDWRKLLAEEVPGIDGVLSFDAPIDVVAMFDPTTSEVRVILVASVGIVSVDGAVEFFRRRGDSVQRLTRHLHRIRIEPAITCLGAPSVGSSIARLVCSNDGEAAETLVPYMTRGLPREQLSASDLHVRVPGEGYPPSFIGFAIASVLITERLPSIRREYDLGHPGFSLALSKLIHALPRNVFAVSGDLVRSTLDVTLDAEHERLEGHLTLQFRGQESWLSQTIGAASAQAAPAPEVFFRMPADAIAASYCASNPALLQDPAKALLEVLDALLDYLELPEKHRAALVTAAGEAALHRGQSVYAKLPSAGLFAFQTDAAPFRRLLEAARASLDDPAFAKRLARLELFDGTAPRMKKRGARRPRLPKGTTVFELVLPASATTRPLSFKEPEPPPPGQPTPAAKPEKKQKPTTVSVFVVVAEHGNWTWVAIGADEAGLSEQLAAAMKSAGQPAREELASLRTEPSVCAGFTTLRKLLGRGFGLNGSPESSAQLERAFTAMPHQGTTPMLWRAGATAAGPTMTGTLRVPRAVFEDAAVGLVTSSSGFAGRWGIR